MGHVYEVALESVQHNIPMANIFHVWDGAEDNTPIEIGDNFHANYVTDVGAIQSSTYTYTRITVTPLDVGNGKNAYVKLISVSGSDGSGELQTGAHVYVKLISDDNGFRSGGKLIGGLAQADVVAGLLTSAAVTTFQTVFDALLVDLTAGGFDLAIYRPTLSTPGFPSISIVAAADVKGLSTNNRRHEAFQS